MTEVVAAVIRRGEEILICRRPQGKNLAGLWEFAGGKVEKGESLPEALVRECVEELGITVAVGREMCDVRHDYGAYGVHITFFECTLASGSPVASEHSEIRWVNPQALGMYVFCPADGEVVEKLSKGVL